MGVYINIELPKSCPECPLADEIVRCPLTGKTYNWGMIERASDCPLVHVPNHGRLIDADALSAKLNVMLSMAFGEGNTAFHFAYRSLRKVVENAPTIIPADHIGDATNMVKAEESTT